MAPEQRLIEQQQLLAAQLPGQQQYDPCSPAYDPDDAQEYDGVMVPECGTEFFAGSVLDR